MWISPKLWKPAPERQPEPWPPEPRSFKSWPCLSMAPAGRYAAIYRGGMLLCYLGPLGNNWTGELSMAVWGQVDAMGASSFEIVTR